MNEAPEKRKPVEQPEGVLARLADLLGEQKARGETPRKIHLIINPAAGLEQPILKTMNLACQTAGVDWEVSVTKQAGDGRRMAQAAAQAGVDAVAVHGGDGTVMEVASGLLGSGVPMAIIPGGTANVMAVELGIPADLVEASALAVGFPARVRKVDMGIVNDHHFMLRASAGFEASMVEGADRELKDRYGLLAYTIAAFQAAADLKIAQYQLTLDGMEVESQGLTCIVANSGSVGRPRFFLATNIQVDDGLLDVLVVRKADIPSLISLAASVVGGEENKRVLQHWQARKITVRADPPQTIQADGEILGQSPMTVEVLPQAVDVIVPAVDPRVLEAGAS